MIKTLHSLRFVFIMLIVFSHVIGKTFDFGGECGVSFFFVLSGFVLSVGYGQRIEAGQFRPQAFFLRQLCKFYPLHLVTLVLMALMDARLGVYYEWYRLLPNILLLQSWIPDDAFYFVANGSSWFLSDMLFFYVVFHLLFRWLTHTPLKQLALVAAVVLALYFLLAFSIPLGSVNSVLYASPLTRLLDFALGILTYRLYASDRGAAFRQWLARQGTARLTLLELATLAWVAASFFAYETLTPRLRCASLFWLVMPWVVFLFAGTHHVGGVISRWLSHPAMQWLGTISFEIYMVHMLILRVGYSLCTSAGLGIGVLATTLLLLFMLPCAYVVKRYFVDRIYALLIKYV